MSIGGPGRPSGPKKGRPSMRPPLSKSMRPTSRPPAEDAPTLQKLPAVKVENGDRETVPPPSPGDILFTDFKAVADKDTALLRMVFSSKLFYQVLLESPAIRQNPSFNRRCGFILNKRSYILLIEKTPADEEPVAWMATLQTLQNEVIGFIGGELIDRDGGLYLRLCQMAERSSLLPK